MIPILPQKMYGNILSKIPSKISIFDSSPKWVPFLKTLENIGWVDFFWVGEEDIRWNSRAETNLYVPWSKVAVLGMVIQPLIGNPYNGYIGAPTIGLMSLSPIIWKYREFRPDRTYVFSPLFFVNEIGPTRVVQLVLFMGI